ncbi:sugar porter family MFS transporter [Gluconobacter japonicus]|uniref:sugar porter family MFS transporter n=1 Tax=Gluconobacter japonicus TaxID=376620 RepID=UPI001B8D24AC|nr:sugar porter family MFS transporter [Gluconobacter japonicus]MBS1050355.1 sugar porter family MFS transporter [Gluconobacter japonicus]
MLNVKDIVLVHSERHDVSYVLRICAVAALGGVLFGYDTSVISGAIDSIKEHFQLSPAQTGWAVSNVVVGCIIGAFLSGWMAHKLGRRLTLFICAILFTISAVGAALATTFSWFIIYRIIGGLAVGVAGAVSPMYMSEVAPKDMRGRALSMEQFAVVGGQLIVFIVNYLIASHSTGQWLSDLGWRWMIGSEVVPCVAFCLAIFFIPESPRWHMLSGQDDKALKTLTRISNEKHAQSVMREIRESFHGTADEAVNLLAILRNTGARWIIFVGMMIAMLQQLTGVNVMMYYAPMVLRTTAGSMQSALFQTIWIGIASLLGCAIGAWFVDRNGRRPLMMWGSLGMIFGLLVVSWALYTQTPGLLALLGMIIFMVLYGMSWGPITWVLISEIFPNRLRSVGMSLSTTMLWIINFAVSQFFPMVNENVYLRSHFHGAFSMWLFAGFTAFAMWFVLKFVPETKGIALEKVEAVMLGKSDPSSATTAAWVEVKVSERN